MTRSQRSHRRNQAVHAAFTLIEVIVVVAIVGLLLAITIPAVQLAREAARRSSCSSNLRQIGLALASYEASFGSLPAGGNGLGYSLHAMILPYLDQNPIYQSVNFNYPADLTEPSTPNFTCCHSVITIFLCPSQSLLPSSTGTSYAGNRGVGERLLPDSGLFAHRNAGPLGSRDIADGTHATVAMSEWIRGPIEMQRRDERGSVFDTPDPLVGVAAFNAFVEECHTIEAQRAVVNHNDKGADWILGGYRHTLYNHTLGINDHSCVSRGLVQEGAYSAGSRHGSGAYCLFADGHVRLELESIDRSVWRALGTRAGKEVIAQ